MTRFSDWPPAITELKNMIPVRIKNVVKIILKCLAAVTICLPKHIKTAVTSIKIRCKNAGFDSKILCYHYVRFFYHNDGWSGTVSAWKFFWDMFALRKKAVVHFNEFDVSSKNQVVLSFDDGYKNFLKYAFPILKLFQYKFELFVIGEYYTGDTISERNLVRNWMSKKDLVRIVQTSKGRLQYHTRTHYRLTDLEDTEMLEKEIRLPEGLQQLDPAGFSWLAYPYCNFNDRIIEIVKKYYQGARAGPNGKARDHPDAVFAMQSIMVHQGTNGGAAFVKEDRDLSFPETPA